MKSTFYKIVQNESGQHEFVITGPNWIQYNFGSDFDETDNREGEIRDLISRKQSLFPNSILRSVILQRRTQLSLRRTHTYSYADNS
jgi:hypothetical protein